MIGRRRSGLIGGDGRMSSLPATPDARTGPSPTTPARERILEAAYRLFTMRGLRAVGVDTIIARAGVAKMTFYRHFRSKEGLALAVLQRREALRTHEGVAGDGKSRATPPPERL